MKRLLLALALCLAAGCSALSGGERGPVSPAGRIKRGMTAAQVETILGRPAHIEEGGPEQESEWYYENGVIVMLRSGKVCFVGQADASEQ